MTKPAFEHRPMRSMYKTAEPVSAAASVIEIPEKGWKPATRKDGEPKSLAKHGADTTESVVKKPKKRKQYVKDATNVSLLAGLKRIDMSGQRFAELIGRPSRSVEEWTRGESRPTQEAMTLLDLIEHCPDARARLEAQHPRKKAST